MWHHRQAPGQRRCRKRALGGRESRRLLQTSRVDLRLRPGFCHELAPLGPEAAVGTLDAGRGGLAAPAPVGVVGRAALILSRALEIVEDLGARATLAIMEHLQAITGEDRYRPSLWLKRRALLDLPIHTPS